MRKLLPGVALVAALALAAWFSTPYVRRVAALDATFVALVLGLAAGALSRHPAPLVPGAQRTMKHALTAGVILLGAEINLAFVQEAGVRAVTLAAVLILATMLTFLLLARLLRVDGDTWALLGAGTGICGLGAVAAAGASLESKDEDVAVAVAAVGILSAVGLLLYPVLGALWALPVDIYGAWSGLSVHAIANAIAAGFAYGDEAGRVATVTKLARVALLAPTLLVLTLLVRRRATAKGGSTPLLPAMVWGFLLVAIAASLVPIPESLVEAGRLAARLLLVLAMAALGYTTRLAHFRQAGPRGILLAVAGWTVLSVAALAGAWIVYR